MDRLCYDFQVSSSLWCYEQPVGITWGRSRGLDKFCAGHGRSGPVDLIRRRAVGLALHRCVLAENLIQLGLKRLNSGFDSVLFGLLTTQTLFLQLPPIEQFDNLD